MELIFTAATVIDEKAYAQMLLAKQRLDQRWLMIPVYLLALPAVWAMTFRIEQPHSLFGWVLRIFVLALTAAVIPPIWRRVQRTSCRSLGRRLFRGLAAPPPAVSYRFYPDRVEVQDGGPCETFGYGEIFRPVETADYFLLFLSKSLCHAVSKDGLSGDAASFESFLSARCSKSCAKVLP